MLLPLAAKNGHADRVTPGTSPAQSTRPASRPPGQKTASGIFLRHGQTRVRRTLRKSLNSRRVAAPAATKSVSGVRYYGQRYYNPGTGRWLSRDPIGEIGGDNLYAITGNDAVNQWDFLGECGNCECVEGVHIENITPYQNMTALSGGLVASAGKNTGIFGHQFDLVVDLDIIKANGNSTDTASLAATLDWGEKVSPAPAWQTRNPSFVTGAYNDMYKLFPSSPTFASWSNRKAPDAGSGYIVAIHDIPGHRVGASTRTLNFSITVTSASSSACNCPNKSFTVTATQILTNSPQTSSFTTP